MSQVRRHPFFWVVVTIAPIVMALYIPVGMIIYKYGTLRRNPGWECRFQAGHCLVTRVDSQGEAAGKLQQGDVILAVDGRSRLFAPGVMGLDMLTHKPPGESYTLTVQRGAAQVDLLLSAQIKRSLRNLIPILLPLGSSLICFTVALIIGLARPEQRFTQLFTITWMSVAVIMMVIALDPIRIFFGPRELKLSILLWLLSFSPVELALAYHFSYRFPPGVPETRFWSSIRNFLYLWAGLLALILTAIRIFSFTNPTQTARFFANHSTFQWFLERSAESLMAFGLIVIGALIIRNFFQLQEVDQRRRLRWVFFGTIIGVFPSLIFFLLNFAFNTLHLSWLYNRDSLKYFDMASNFTLAFVPLSVSYAIIRDKMYDIHVVVRQGLHYLFAKNMLRLFIYLPAAILIYTVIQNRDRRITDVIFSNAFYIFLTVIAVLGLKFRHRLSDLLDRKFFREAYNSEKILLSLIDEIKNINSMSELSKWVTVQVDSALHPKQILVFYRRRERGEMALGFSSGEHSQNLRIPDSARFLRIAEQMGSAHQFPSKDTAEVPEQEKDWLKELGTHLIVPMNGSDQRLVGLLLLGEKKSEQPYTKTDRKMLEALAGQIAVICENLLLKERVDEDLRVRREVLSHLQDQKRNLVMECPACGTCYDSGVYKCAIEGAELMLTLPVDRVVSGKYRLDKLLGRGGMGAVYQATDLSLNREVAIKVLIGSMFGDRLALRRFEREARASASLAHPNIITVYDYGGIEGEGAYLVMELLHGVTQRLYLRQHGNIHPLLAADWFNQILEGMKTAHQLGIIHRDLKPENILLAKQTEAQALVKILDFGLAKIKFLDSAESKSLTAPGTILGTLSYMSPEQIAGGEVDERSDIFSIGVMVIEALTGQQPFTGQTSSDVALAILQKSYELPGDSAEIKQLNAVIQKCIAKNRNNRYASLRDLQEELTSAIRNVPPFPAAESTASGDSTKAETRIVL